MEMGIFPFLRLFDVANETLEWNFEVFLLQEKGISQNLLLVHE